jgi:hypothetical protein
MLDDHLTPKIDIVATVKAWWKEKRLLYNLIVGVFGLLTIGFEFVFLDRSWSWLLKVVPMVLFFGISVNLCFSIGKTVEVFIYLTFSKAYDNDLGKIIFWIGTFLTVWLMLSTEYNIYSHATSNVPRIMR